MAATNEIVTLGKVPLAAVAAGFVLSVLVSIFLVSTLVNNDHQSQMARFEAEKIQEKLDLKVAFIQNHLNTIANTIHLAEVVSTSDAATRATEETTLIDLIPHAIRVRIFGPGEAEVERDAIPPFSYTSLDLVNSAEIGSEVHPEAINANGRWIISIATPIRIPGDNTIRGTLFVYLSMDAIAADINVPGGLKLIQTVGSANSVEIFTAGSGTTGDETNNLALTNPNWSIEYSPATADEAQVGNVFIYLVPSLLFALVAGIGTVVGLRQVNEQLGKDISHLGHQVSSVVAGTYNHSDAYLFKDFIQVDESLTRLGGKVEETEPVRQLDVTAIPKPAAEVADEVVDIEMLDDDEELTEATDDLEESEELDLDLEELEEEIDDAQDYAGIFRAYDIRGIVNETLTTEIIHDIGLAIGTEAGELGEQTIVVGADGRISSPDIVETLIEGLRASGRDVVNIGFVPTPVLYFATHNSDTQSGVMVTGSHNPADYNGFKIVLGGNTLVEEDIQKLYARIQNRDFSEGEGDLSEIDISEEYMDAIADDVVVAQPLKVVLDCGNGIGGQIAPDLFDLLGCDVIPLYCDVDGTFPNHPPDPTVLSNLDDLILMVKSEKADLGIALDGDADRLIAVSSSGKVILPDQLLMLFVKDVVSRNPGSDIVYDIKCSRHLNSVISGFGGRPVICRSGHSYMKQKMVETNAILGGEMSGHVCFSERWFGFDDGIYSAARLLEIVGSQTEGLDELLSEFPQSLSTPELFIPVSDTVKFDIVNALVDSADFPEATLTKIDGLRVDFADGWGLIRASNTNPQLTLRFEADDSTAMSRIKDLFRSHLQSVDESLDFE